MVQRLAAILLIGTFLALGGGLLEYAHYLQHVHDDSIASRHGHDHDPQGFVRQWAAGTLGGTVGETGAPAQPATPAQPPTPAQPAPLDPHHDDNSAADCFLHGLLHAPIVSIGWVPLLVCLGLFVAFLTLLAQRPAAARAPARLDCRGPPALLSI